MSSIAERYARATVSSHLEWKLESSDIDAIIAAGLIHDGIGPRLMRLRNEFDSISRLPGARNMIPRLKSSAMTIEWLMEFAQSLALKRRMEIDDHALREIVARLVDLFLDPNCPTCDGRGMIGGYGTPQVICDTCSGAMKRQLLWEQDIERFAKHLGDKMAEMVLIAGRKMTHLLPVVLELRRQMLRASGVDAP